MLQSAYPPNHLKMGALPEPQNWNICRGKLASIWVNMQLQKKCFLEMIMLSLYQCLCAWVLNSWHSQLVFTHKKWRIMQCCVVARRKSCFFQWFQIMARKSIICNNFFFQIHYFIVWFTIIILLDFHIFIVIWTQDHDLTPTLLLSNRRDPKSALNDQLCFRPVT